MVEFAVRRMTPEGIRRLTELAASAEGKLVDAAALEAIAADTSLSEPFLPGAPLEVPVFARKIDLGRFLVEDVPKTTLAAMLAEQRVWPWLSVALRDSVIPMRNGGREMLDISRHVIMKNGGRSLAHRHLVRGAVVGYHRFGEFARTILAACPHEHSKVEEALMSRREIINLSCSREIAEVVDKLYYNPKTKGVRNGAKGHGPGSVGRLIDVLSQIDRCYDIPSMTASQILDLLPKPEFDFQRKAAGRKKAA